jgi:hypothetical protein
MRTLISAVGSRKDGTGLDLRLIDLAQRDIADAVINSGSHFHINIPPKKFPKNKTVFAG